MVVVATISNNTKLTLSIKNYLSFTDTDFKSSNGFSNLKTYLWRTMIAVF